MCVCTRECEGPRADKTRDRWNIATLSELIRDLSVTARVCTAVKLKLGEGELASEDDNLQVSETGNESSLFAFMCVPNRRGCPEAQRLAPLINMRVGCPGFSSRLGNAVLSLHVSSVYRAGYLAVI